MLDPPLLEILSDSEELCYFQQWADRCNIPEIGPVSDFLVNVIKFEKRLKKIIRTGRYVLTETSADGHRDIHETFLANESSPILKDSKVKLLIQFFLIKKGMSRIEQSLKE